MTNRPIRTVDDLPHGHWIARQLPAGTSLRTYGEDEAISALTSAVQEAVDSAGLTRTELAGILGTTKGYVSQVLNGSTNMTLRTLGALLWAAGRQVRELRTVAIGGEVRPQTIPMYTVTMNSSDTRALSYSPEPAYLSTIQNYHRRVVAYAQTSTQ